MSPADSPLDSPPFTPAFRRFLRGAGIVLIPVNLAIMLWMFGLFAFPGEGVSGDWQRGLWLSQYLGIISCVVMIRGLHDPWINGFYAFTFLFPFIAFFGAAGNIFSFLNHSTHFLGWVVLCHPRVRVDLRGVKAGFASIMWWLLLCLWLQYPDGMGANANNVSDPLLPLLVVGGVIWLGLVYSLLKAKERRRSRLGATTPAVVPPFQPWATYRYHAERAWGLVVAKPVGPREWALVVLGVISLATHSLQAALAIAVDPLPLFWGTEVVGVVGGLAAAARGRVGGLNSFFVSLVWLPVIAAAGTGVLHYVNIILVLLIALSLAFQSARTGATGVYLALSGYGILQLISASCLYHAGLAVLNYHFIFSPGWGILTLLQFGWFSALLLVHQTARPGS